MKFVVSLWVLMVLLSGCGTEEMPKLSDDPSFFENADGRSETAICREPVTAYLNRSSTNSVAPKLIFTSTSKKTVDMNTLAGAVRCNEVNAHFSGANIKMDGSQFASKIGVEISFLNSEAEKRQMADGAVVDAVPSTASIQYTDGSLQESLFGIDLRCPEKFSVSCDAQEIDGKKECVSYKASASSQTCTFRAMGLPFVFSDHRVTAIDMIGELNFTSRNVEMKVGKIALDGMH